MVYIFFVQPGDMMTFDNEISIMQSVGDLKEKIEEKCNIPVDQQVLLINGGESLDSQKNLCSYMAGTDTNPIYLFSLNYDASKLEILKNLNYDDSNLKKRLTDCLNLPVSLSTVRTRTLIAQDFHSLAKEQLEFCESMVQEQHLQNQGWSAVIANLDDIVKDFKKRWELFQKFYADFETDRKAYEGSLNSYEEDKKILQKIPVIDTLLESQKDTMDSSKMSETSNNTSETEPKTISLYDWICSSSSSALDDVYSLCKSKLEKIDCGTMPALTKRITEALQSAEKQERREIEGLSKRLYDLEELRRKLQKNVQHQADMAQSFMQNQNSVASLKDATSILPDLCATHAQQMDLIMDCHQKLMQDRNRIVKAKYELSKSLCARIGWIQSIENKLCELDASLVYFHEHLLRLGRHLGFFQQLHVAPTTYMNAVVEVVRRRSFTQIFYLWASDLACQSLTFHNEEITRRKEFGALFEGHFLQTLFPGMGDVPPAFATEVPPMFDTKLPKLGEEEIEKLKREVPDYVEHLVLPDMNHVVSFYGGRSSVKGKEDKVDDSAIEEKLMQAVSDVGLASNLDKNLLKTTGSETSLASAPGLPNLKDDKGCESETDTEEFEKVGQSPLELNFPQGVATGAVAKVSEKQDASTCTEVRNQILPPKKPPRSFRATHSLDTTDQRTLSISTNESFTNIKNISLDSIDELSSIKNFTSTNTSDSCFNSHCNQHVGHLLASTSNSSFQLSDVASLSKSSLQTPCQSSMLSGSKSVSPQSPDGAQPDFATEEFYIDESLPSSVGTGNSQGSEFVRQLDTANIVVAMLQDNLQISRTEHDRLKTLFADLSSMAKLATASLRSDLHEIRSRFESESRELSKQYEELGGSWELLVTEVDRNEKEIVESMRRINSEDKERFQVLLMEKEEAMKRLDGDKRAVENKIQERCQQLVELEEALAKQNDESTNKIDDLLKQLHEKDLDKERALKELSENLKMEHKAELESIKSRFKLMTMEKSPSLSSLEKEKSGESSYPSQSNFLAQLSDNFQIEKENAVAEERKRWERLMDEKTKELCQSFEEEKTLTWQSAAETVSKDKDRQIEDLLTKIKAQELEVMKWKTIIQQLTEEHGKETDLLEEVQLLKRENKELLEKVSKIMEKEEAVMSGSVDTLQENFPVPLTLFTSEGTPGNPKAITISSCKEGDIVLAFWDETRKYFKILQESKHPYLLHPDSVNMLGLDQSSKNQCRGVVVAKEVVQSVKSENRLNVPLGTKFYRVTLKPLHCDDRNYPECFEESSSHLQDSEAVDHVDQATPATDYSSALEGAKSWPSQEWYATEEKAKLLKEYRERENQYKAEIAKYKSIIETLKGSQEAEPEEASRRETQGVQEEVPSEKEAYNMSTSSEGKLDASTSPLGLSPPPPDMSRSEILSTRPHRLSIDSCKTGDAVLLLWDQAHENFKILQHDSKHTYFLHSDSLDRLGLSITEGRPNKEHSVGEVVDKEYCQTRKSENRYKVPKGAKFFRVKVRPISPLHRDSRDLSQSAFCPRHTPHMPTSQSVLATFEPVSEEHQSPSSSQTLAEASVIALEEHQSQESGRDHPRSGRADSGYAEISEQPIEALGGHGLESRERGDSGSHFAEDSGIEEATVATELNDR